MKIKMIFAKNKANSIGHKGNLIYRISEDLANFKKETENNIIIMGFKSFLEIKRPLKNRINVVVYDVSRPIRNRDYYESIGFIFKPSLEVAINDFKAYNSDSDVFIIGGSKLFIDAVNLANKGIVIDSFIVSTIDDDFLGDTIIPEFDLKKYTLTKEVHFNNVLDKNSNNRYNLSIIYYNL